MATSTIPSGVYPNIKSICAEVVDAFPKITHVYGYNSVPDHNNKRCLDLMVYNSEWSSARNLSKARQVALGNDISRYLWDSRVRLGLDLIIFNRKILRTYTQSSGSSPSKVGVWAEYRGSSPHTDHVHAQFKVKKYVPPITEEKPGMPDYKSQTAEDVWTSDVIPYPEPGDKNPTRTPISVLRYIWWDIKEIKELLTLIHTELKKSQGVE